MHKTDTQQTDGQAYRRWLRRAFDQLGDDVGRVSERDHTLQQAHTPGVEVTAAP